MQGGIVAEQVANGVCLVDLRVFPRVLLASELLQLEAGLGEQRSGVICLVTFMCFNECSLLLGLAVDVLLLLCTCCWNFLLQDAKYKLSHFVNHVFEPVEVLLDQAKLCQLL